MAVGTSATLRMRFSRRFGAAIGGNFELFELIGDLPRDVHLAQSVENPTGRIRTGLLITADTSGLLLDPDDEEG
jgi:hypothetical protein